VKIYGLLGIFCIVLKQDAHGHNIKKIMSYLTENTHLLHKDQPLNAI